MARTLTPERQKLKYDAIRLRQELGWSIDQIAGQLSLPRSTIHLWLSNNSEAKMSKNTTQLSLNTVHVMDCIEGIKRLPHEYVDLVFKTSRLREMARGIYKIELDRIAIDKGRRYRYNKPRYHSFEMAVQILAREGQIEFSGREEESDSPPV